MKKLIVFLAFITITFESTQAFNWRSHAKSAALGGIFGGSLGLGYGGFQKLQFHAKQLNEIEQRLKEDPNNEYMKKLYHYHRKREWLYTALTFLPVLGATASGTYLYTSHQINNRIDLMASKIAARNFSEKELKAAKKDLHDSFSKERASFDKAVINIVGGDTDTSGDKLHVRDLVDAAIDRNLQALQK